ncbi:MAG TPA: thermonuclease family protein [Cyclobacteriaceae bacterium]
MRHFLIFLIGAGSLIQARAEDSKLMGTVVSVIDGNTLEIQSDNSRVVRVFLYGIDCPELGQAYGEKARICLQNILLNQQVVVEFVKRDRLGNHYAHVITEIGVDPRIDLLREGLAWTIQDDAVAELEPYRSFAQQKRKGLWNESKPTPPWIYRREQSMLQPKKS